MKIINLTPHTIVMQAPDGARTSINSSGVARVVAMPGERANNPVADAPCDFYTAPTFGAVEGLPEPQADTIFIVSAIVASRCKGRFDVFSPGTGPSDGAIRENGQVVAVTRLIQAPK